MPSRSTMVFEIWAKNRQMEVMSRPRTISLKNMFNVQITTKLRS
jgi:hypothetical protein